MNSCSTDRFVDTEIARCKRAAAAGSPPKFWTKRLGILLQTLEKCCDRLRKQIAELENL